MPVLSQSLVITALSDLIISARHGTEGGHDCLDHIPGSVLLGAVVAEWCRNGNAFDPVLFLSGKLRFGNAYPVGAGASSNDSIPSVPVPLSWHHPKDDPQKIRNGITCALDENTEASGEGQIQWKQFRKGYVAPGLNEVLERRETRHSSRMKTSISRCDYGRPKKSQLFGYQAIQSGQVFRTKIEADASINPECFHKVIRALIQGGLRLGRSRSAEFGRVQIEQTSPPPDTTPQESPDGAIVFFLESDLALVREGNPVLEPSPEDFYLNKSFRMDLARTFIRIRTFSPWVAFRDGYDMERQVIAKGSVLTFCPSKGECSGVSLRDLQERLDQGLGLHCSDGLGKVLVNPPFLMQMKEETFGTPADIQHKQAPEQKPACSPLTKLLSHRVEIRKLYLSAYPIASNRAEKVHALMLKMKKTVGDIPGKTQWSNVQTIASARITPQQCRKELEDYFTNSLRSRVWTCEVRDMCFTEAGHARSGSLADYLLGKKGKEDELWKRCIALTATMVIRLMSSKEHSKQEIAHVRR